VVINEYPLFLPNKPRIDRSIFHGVKVKMNLTVNLMEGYFTMLP
jgi:hypothetical protein